jgi:Lon protease-like protein
VLPLKETVVFPESMTPLAIGQERSIKLIDDVVAGDRLLALVTSKDGDVEQPGWEELYDVGTAAMVHKLIKVPDGTLRILVQGIERIRLASRVQDDPYLVGTFEPVPDVVEETPELEALTRNVQMLYGRIVGLVPYLPSELELAAANVDDPSALSHLVASTLRLETTEKQRLLELPDVEERLRELPSVEQLAAASDGEPRGLLVEPRRVLRGGRRIVHRARPDHDEQAPVAAGQHVLHLAAAVQHGVVQIGEQRQLVVEQRRAHQRHDRVDALIPDSLHLGDGHGFLPPPGARVPAPGA